MTLTALQLRQTLTSDALLDQDELLALLPGDDACKARWFETHPLPGHESPSGVTLFRWGDAAVAYGLQAVTPDHDMMTVAEVATLLRVPESRIYQLTSDKRIPHLKLGHRTLRFDRAAILDWTRATAIEQLERHNLPKPRSSVRALRRSRQPDALTIAPLDWAASK